MPEILKYEDLCSSCNHGSSCGRLANLKRPIWYCDEFDRSSPPMSEKLRAEQIREKMKVYDKSAGLCFNCAFRDSCDLARPNGGVWHCEKYSQM